MIIYRENAEFLTIEVDNQTQLKQELQGEDVVMANFTLEFYYDFKIGDYINWRGKNYTIFKTPETGKQQTNQIQYSLEFGSDQYRLLNALYFLDGNSEFFLMGDLRKFANLLVVNLNRLAGTAYYQLGTIPETEVKNLGFNNSNCLFVLQQICTEFGKEFIFSEDGRTIDFKEKIGVDTGLTFRFKKGLRHIKRQKISDKDLVTRLYAFGGERNIPHSYGSKRLTIPAMESNVDIFGVIEGVVIFDEIYPRRTGTVTAIDPGNIFRFVDNTMDFDINTQLMPGVTAKVTFNTGYLAGYEFELHRYDSGPKMFHLVEYEDETGLKLPNSTLKQQVGDEYVIHDVIMPQTYVDAAEAELTAMATAHLSDNSMPNTVYEVVPDYPYLRKNLIQLNVGDIITITDDDFGVTFQTRILNLTQSLANPYLYSIKIGNKVIINYVTKVLADQKELDNSIRIERTDRTADYNRIRRNLRNIDELRDSIFDPDGYFDPEHIRPLSIETSMLSVGGKSQQFIIRELLIEANYQSDPARTRISNGTLVHFLIADTIKEWTLTGSVKAHADNNQYYYIYARCVRDGTTGDFLTSSVQYKVDAGDTYYYFLIGVLHSVQDGVRGISLTYGQTTINGKFITTGRVQSIDGINFFDLDSGQFFVGDTNNSLDWNVTNPGALTLKGALVQSDSGDTFPLPVFRGDYSPVATYYRGDQIVYGDSTYIMIHSTPQTNRPPTNATYWKLYTAGGTGADGQDGTSIVWRGTFASPPLNPQNGWAYYNSTDKRSYVRQGGTWQLMTVDGAPGAPGAPGGPGPSIVFRGDHSASTVYYNNAQRRDVVKNGTTYYLYSGPNGQALSWAAANWTNFGASFSSVATDLLLAENANIASWRHHNGNIRSQDGSVTLYGAQGNILIQGVRLTDQDDMSRIDKDGVLVTSNGSFVDRPPATYDGNGNPIGTFPFGPRATIIGKNARAGSFLGRSIGVYGSTEKKTQDDWGGWFDRLKVEGEINIEGLRYRVRRITASITLLPTDVIVSCSNSGSINVSLPPNPTDGHVLLIRRNFEPVTVLGNGRSILNQIAHNSISLGNGQGDMGQFIYDGVNWLYNYLPRNP